MVRQFKHLFQAPTGSCCPRSAAARRWLLTLPLLAICLIACSDGPQADAKDIPARAEYDLSPIDVSVFATDPAVRQRVLFMRFGEAAQRLGALELQATVTYRFSRGGEDLEQRDLFSVVQDRRQNFRLTSSTPGSSVELALVGEEVFVRLDKGPMRRKPRREVETELWSDIAFSSIRQALDLFRPRLVFVDPRPQEAAGRPAIRLSVALGEQPAEAPPLPPPETPLPVAPPARWRELAQPMDLEGHIWVDAATGVITKATFEGRLEVADREVRPTTLKLSLNAEASNIGKVKPLEAPEAIAELRRIPLPRDPLSFFRDKLPLPKKPTAPEAKPGN